jgi:hypothetical protein
MPSGVASPEAADTGLVGLDPASPGSNPGILLTGGSMIQGFAQPTRWLNEPAEQAAGPVLLLHPPSFFEA